jgi:hypothetical protein
MKKLLFVLAFTFIGYQAFSQLYSVLIETSKSDHPSGCPSTQNINSSWIDGVMTTISPTGSITYNCLPGSLTGDHSVTEASYLLIHQELNNIISMGYKIVGNPIDDFSVYYQINQINTLILLSIP